MPRTADDQTVPTTENGMTPLDHALSLAARGFYVFPILPKGYAYRDRHGKDQVSDGKHPALAGWQDWATRDESKIRKRWAHGDYSVAISTSRFGDDKALCVVDVDTKASKRGDESVLELELAGFELPQTLEHSTPSGGRHLLYVVDEPLRQGTDVLGSGLDIRSRGGYIVAPGSAIDGRPYAQINGHNQIVPAPDWLVSRLGTDRRGLPAHRDPLPGVDAARATDRALAYLKSAAGAAIGSRGSTAYKIAARLKDFGCSESEALALMLEHWVKKCDPPMPESDLIDSINHAFRYGREIPGSAAPEAVFSANPAENEDENINPLEKLNRDHAYVLVGGTGFILWETFDEQGRPTTELLGLATFHQMHASKVFQAGKKRTMQLTEAWMTWDKRRTYRRLCFAPGESLPPDFFNLWRGWAVTPAPGDWSKMRAHIKDVICAGNAELDRYVMGWLALMVQKPGIRAEVALVLRGGKGVGKGVLGNCLCSIFGRHSIHVTNAKHLIGSFNGHMRETAFIFADEAFFAGDRQHEGTLKGLVTEPDFVLEAKGKDALRWTNRLHLLMASNDHWVIPASVDERRFCVLDVPPTHQQDHQYFGALMRQMETGGLEAMLFDLLNMNVEGFNIRAVPNTAALTDQKLESLQGGEKWLGEVLDEGAVWGHPWEDSEPLSIQKSEAYASYCDRSRRVYAEYRPQDAGIFWRRIRAVMKAAGLAVRDVRPRENGGRIQRVVFPSLIDARAAFAKFIGGEIEWSGTGVSPPKSVADIFS